MAVTGVGVIVQEDEPISVPDGSSHIYAAWLKTSTQQWYVNVNWAWVEVSDIPDYAPLVHSHPTHGDINLTGSVSVGGVAGLTGNYEGTFKKIKVVNGIITEFELV